MDARGWGNSGSSSDGVPTAGVNLDGERGWLGKRAMTEHRHPMAFAALKRCVCALDLGVSHEVYLVRCSVATWWQLNSGLRSSVLV